MLRLFVSVPTQGRTDEKVQGIKETVLRRVRAAIDPTAELIDSYVREDAPVDGDRAGVWYLGESLKRLSGADMAFFADGWSNHRGCRIERAVCQDYGLSFLDEALLSKWESKGRPAVGNGDNPC